ncbi:MAG TPA: sugar ABC transporter substrate-binding protein [Asanoa sp.]
MNDPHRLLAATLGVALLATGCTGSDPKPPVKLLVSGAPEEIAAFRALAQAYQAKNTGSAVQIIEAGSAGDLITRLSTSIAGGAPPDVFLINYRAYGQFAGKDAIEPAQERLDSSEIIEPGDFYPVAMEAFQWRGRQLCMPQNASSLAVYYNKGLFAKYGVPEPKAGWAWNDLLATASALTRDANGKPVNAGEADAGGRTAVVHGLSVEPVMIRVAPFAWSNGGEVVDDPQHPTRFTLEDPATREALRNFVDLRQAYGVVPTDQEAEAEDEESRFVNGRLAMIMSSRRVTTTFRTITGFDWDVAPLPTYGTPANILHSDAYCITRGAADKDEAWRFVEFAMSPQGQRIIAATGRTVPSNVEVSRSPAFLDPAQRPKNGHVWLDAIPVLRRVPTVSTWPEIEDATSGLLENAMYRGDPIDKVIAELDATTRPLFARAEAP